MDLDKLADNAPAIAVLLDEEMKRLQADLRRPKTSDEKQAWDSYLSLRERLEQSCFDRSHFIRVISVIYLCKALGRKYDIETVLSVVSEGSAASDKKKSLAYAAVLARIAA